MVLLRKAMYSWNFASRHLALYAEAIIYNNLAFFICFICKPSHVALCKQMLILEKGH